MDVTIAALGAPLAWSVGPVSSKPGHSSLEIEAGPETDLFVDPGTSRAVTNAPRLLATVPGGFQLSARVSVEFRAGFDAAALLLWESDRAWAKLCFEASPALQPTVVSVVTRGVSDDCNSFVIEEGEAWLRVSRLGPAYAFHASTNGSRWTFVRHFSLGDETACVGFLAQSPRGAGCTVRFDEICFSAERLTDLRSGA